MNLLSELNQRLEAPVELEDGNQRMKYEQARRLLGQRLAAKVDNLVDAPEFLRRYHFQSQEPSNRNLWDITR